MEGGIHDYIITSVQKMLHTVVSLNKARLINILGSQKANFICIAERLITLLGSHNIKIVKCK